jgi:hypothetical protein
MLMNMHHDSMCAVVVLVEEPFQDVNYEFHRRVIIIEDQHAIEARPLRLGLGFGDNGCPWAPRGARTFAIIIVTRQPQRAG